MPAPEATQPRAGANAAAGSAADAHWIDREIDVTSLNAGARAPMALMQPIPTEPSDVPGGGTSVGTSAVGTSTRMRNGQQRPRVSRQSA